MPKTTLKHFGWWTLIVGGVIVGSLAFDEMPYWQMPKISSVKDAEEIVQKGLVTANSSTRYEVVEVSIENCQIRTFFDDINICGDEGTVRSSEYFIDLKVFELIELSSLPRTHAQGVTQLFNVKARRASQKETETVNYRFEQLLSQARSEIGGGWPAAVRASENLLNEYPEESLKAWSRATICSGASWVSPFKRTVAFAGADIDRFRLALRKLNRVCKRAN